MSTLTCIGQFAHKRSSPRSHECSPSFPAARIAAMQALVQLRGVRRCLGLTMPNATREPLLSPVADRGEVFIGVYCEALSDISAKTGCHPQFPTNSLGGDSRDACDNEVSLGDSRRHGHEAMPTSLHHNFYPC